MLYLITFVVLLLCEVGYMLIAKYFGILQPVLPHSSHKQSTLTGGGVIFPVAMLLFAAIFHNELSRDIILMLGGMCVLATISMIDDIKPVSPVLRLIAQILVIGICYFQLCTEDTAIIYLLIMIFGVGFINAFNFIDGINGIMSAYALVTLATIYYAYNQADIPSDSVLYPMVMFNILAIVVFAIFNMRCTAKIFSGDVGSIALGFIIIFLIWQLISATGSAVYLVFLIVCAVEVVLTTIGRLFEGANIIYPHRRFLYEILTNEGHYHQLAVALSYAAVQLVINVGFFLMPEPLQWVYTILVTSALVTIYFVIKSKIIAVKR